jgi:hypothetical protein
LTVELGVVGREHKKVLDLGIIKSENSEVGVEHRVRAVLLAGRAGVGISAA